MNTAAELLTLDPGELNRRLGLLLGYTFHDVKEHKGEAVYEKFWLRPGVKLDDITADDICWREGTHVPRFCSDHNAVAAVRAGFHGNTHPSATTDKEKAYRDALCRVMGCAWYQSARLLCATPREMTVALILCLSDQ